MGGPEVNRPDIRRNSQPDVGTVPQPQPGCGGPGNVLDNELWKRRHDRLDQVRAREFPSQDVPLASLVLALARLTAQRDAKLMTQQQF